MVDFAKLRWQSLVCALFFLATVSSQTAETDNDRCVMHSDCSAQICLKGLDANKKCLSASSGNLGLASIDTADRWEVREVSADRFEVSVVIGTGVDAEKRCLVEAAGSGALALDACLVPKLWRFNLVSLAAFANNVWQISPAETAGACVSAETSDGTAPATSADFAGELKLKLENCLAHGIGNETGGSAAELVPQTFVFKSAVVVSPRPTRSPIALDNAVGRMCLKEYPHLCIGLSLPDGVVTDGLPIQVKHVVRNEEKDLAFLKLEWRLQQPETRQFRFREERISPLSKEDSCVAVSDDRHEGEILLLPCNESGVQEWGLMQFKYPGNDAETVWLYNFQTHKCATVIKCAEKTNGCPRNTNGIACESTREKSECSEIKAGAFVRLKGCVFVPSTSPTQQPSLATASPLSVPPPVGSPTAPTSTNPTAAPSVGQSLAPPTASDNSSGLLTAVLVILLLGAVIFAYFKIRKHRFTELKGGEDDFGDGFSTSSTNTFVDEPLSRSRNDVEIVKIS